MVIVACGTQEPREATFDLRLPQAMSCRPPAPLEELLVEALGDFPASDAETIEVVRVGASGVIDRFPTGTQLVRVRAQSRDWRGEGIGFLDSEGDVSHPLTLLPEGRECALADPALVLEGGATLALSGGGMLLVGGEREGLGQRRVILLPPGGSLGERVEPALTVPRVGAGVVQVGDQVLIAGGALGAAGPAHDTYERFDVTTGEMVPGVGTLLAPRRDFGLIALDASTVMLVGGRAVGDGPGLATVELLDVERGESRSLAPLPFARVSPTVLRLDDGSIVAVGGFAETGAAVGDVFTYDLEQDQWSSLEDVRFPSLPDAVALPLPGARVAVVASTRDGRSSAIVRVIRTSPSADYFDLDLSGAMPPLMDVRAVPLRDGRIRMTGVIGSTPRAFTVDVGRGLVEETSTSSTTRALVDLADGTVVAFSLAGASKRRQAGPTAFDHPPATLLPEDFAVDAPERWRAEGAAMRALTTDARVDLPTLRFAAFEVDLTTTGDVELLLVRDVGAPVRVRLQDEVAGPALCDVVREAGTPLRIVRTRDELFIETGADSRRCRIDDLTGRVGVAFRAAVGATVGPVRITRL